jgi:ribosomal protein S17
LKYASDVVRGTKDVNVKHMEQNVTSVGNKTILLECAKVSKAKDVKKKQKDVKKKQYIGDVVKSAMKETKGMCRNNQETRRS